MEKENKASIKVLRDPSGKLLAPHTNFFTYKKNVYKKMILKNPKTLRKY